MPGMLALLIAKLNDVLKAILPLIAVVCVLQVALVGAPAVPPPTNSRCRTSCFTSLSRGGPIRMRASAMSTSRM